MPSSDASFARIGVLVAFAASSLCWACGNSSNVSSEPTTIVEDAGGAKFDAGPVTGRCAAIEQEQAIEGFNHVAVCSVVKYGTKPPSSGDHYPVWAAYQTYTTAIPEGFWVHNLEHGAIVISYNCPTGCDGDITAAEAMFAALPDDPLCDEAGEGVRHRAIITPDPKLDVRIAASAWGWTLRANCFDPTVFKAFAKKHYGQGREAICENGDDVSTEPSTCGT